jgi:hypothetical protein
LTNVTFVSSSGEPNVEVDGSIYVSGITLPEDLTLTHTLNATIGCSIFGATNFVTVETQPFNPTGPWSEITGQITGPVVAIDCQ